MKIHYTKTIDRREFVKNDFTIDRLMKEMALLYTEIVQ